MKITGNENTETEDEKHNKKESKNVEFVNRVHPNTGLRLRVPLQWN
jgi:hypothetical protein